MNLNVTWSQHPDNPLIHPVFPEWLLGDPVVVPPERSPDGLWHIFLNTIPLLVHYLSRDGIHWKRKNIVCPGMRAFILQHQGEYLLYYEYFVSPWRSIIKMRRSKDLRKWSRSEKILMPSLEWEGDKVRTNGNPCVVKTGDGFRMYYSASSVFLPDLGFGEPKYIGVAESPSPFGPFEKRPEPIIGPDYSNPYRNRGAGAIKVYRDDENDRWLGFNNWIYADEKDRSRSAVFVIVSRDGINWEPLFEEPIIKPDKGWRRALVYQLDVVERPDGELWLYYNCRDGWKIGRERIGLEIGRPE